ncbi:MAG: DUF192 domain-containing protein [Candidatus Saccharimonadales bacterium]
MSLKKERLSWPLIGFLLVAIVAAVLVILPQFVSQTTLRLGDGVYKMRALSQHDSEKMIQQDIAELQQNKALLHVYDRDNMWVIDTRYRTAEFDIVWLDSQKKVVHVVKNASAESRPDTVFSPKVAARYIIELDGGTVDAKTIRIGGMAYFEDKDIQDLK